MLSEFGGMAWSDWIKVYWWLVLSGKHEGSIPKFSLQRWMLLFSTTASLGMLRPLLSSSKDPVGPSCIIKDAVGLLLTPVNVFPREESIRFAEHGG